MFDVKRCIIDVIDANMIEPSVLPTWARLGFSKDFKANIGKTSLLSISNRSERGLFLTAQSAPDWSVQKLLFMFSGKKKTTDRA